MNPALVLLPILLPLLGGLALALPTPLRRPGPLRVFLAVLLAAQLGLAVFLAAGQDVSLTLFSLAERLPFFFRLDGLARFFSLLCCGMFLVVGVYAFGYMKHEQNEARFFTFYLLVLGMLCGLAYSGNLLTLYLFFEVMTLLSVPLVLHSMTKQAVAAAFKYLFYSIAGASLALIGFFIIYTYGPSVAFTPGGVLDAAAFGENAGMVRAGALCSVIGFGAKAGMFPLHAWLPDAHPVAPAPASAILSGVITKAGVFACLRFVYQLVGPELLRGSYVQYTWLALALLTALMGSFMAYKAPLLKRRLAWSSVSQVSYILFGLACLTAGGVLGALLHLVAHSLIKDGLFLAAGNITSATGRVEVDSLRGIGRRMPVTLWCFTIMAVAIVGIPPTAGFVSKWFLSTASLAAPTGFFSWLGPVVLLVCALLAAAYFFPIPIHGFFPGADVPEGSLARKEVGAVMWAPPVLLAAAVVVLGLFPGPLVDFINGLGLVPVV